MVVESPKPFIPHSQWMAYCPEPIPVEREQVYELHTVLVQIIRLLLVRMRLGFVGRVIH